MDAAAANWPQAMEGLVRERKVRPQKQLLNCPRCNSTNTKFCYYNNYSLSQPRYFCKTCRRYWTEGGSLRNIPVGGGSRKNKKPSSSNKINDPNPKETRDLDLGISTLNSKPDLLKNPSSSLVPIGTGYSVLPLPLPVIDPGLGFPCMSEFMKPASSSSLSFSLDGIEIGIGSGYGGFQETNVKQFVFPFEDLKHVSNHGAQTGDWTW